MLRELQLQLGSPGWNLSSTTRSNGSSPGVHLSLRTWAAGLQKCFDTNS